MNVNACAFSIPLFYSLNGNAGIRTQINRYLLAYSHRLLGSALQSAGAGYSSQVILHSRSLAESASIYKSIVACDSLTQKLYKPVCISFYRRKT